MFVEVFQLGLDEDSVEEDVRVLKSDHLEFVREEDGSLLLAQVEEVLAGRNHFCVELGFVVSFEDFSRD